MQTLGSGRRGEEAADEVEDMEEGDCVNHIRK